MPAAEVQLSQRLVSTPKAVTAVPQPLLSVATPQFASAAVTSETAVTTKVTAAADETVTESVSELPASPTATALPRSAAPELASAVSPQQSPQPESMQLPPQFSSTASQSSSLAKGPEKATSAIAASSPVAQWADSRPAMASEGPHVSRPEAEDPLPSTSPTPAPTETTPPAPAPSLPPEPATQDIFEDVFGRPRQLGPQQVIVPLLLNEQVVGQVLVIVPGGDQVAVLVATDEFLSIIGPEVRSPVAEDLAATSQADGTLDVQQIREAGIAVNFDSSRLELQVTIPPALRSAAVSSVNAADVPAALARAVSPSAVSGYVNLRGGQEVVWSGTADSMGRQPLQLSFDGVLNFQGWVLEGSYRYQEAATPTWQRGPLRLVHDDIDTAIRYQVGEVTPPCGAIRLACRFWERGWREILHSSPIR